MQHKPCAQGEVINMASNVSYRTIRNDFHTHPKTAGLTPFARDLFMQCLAANLVGALQRSEKQMARMANMRESDVRRGISELVNRGICQHFEQDETLWLIECADEQIKNANTWKSARAVVSTLSPVVQAAIKARYAKQLGIGLPDTVSPNGSPQPSTRDAFLKKNTQDQDQEQDQEQECATDRVSLPTVPTAAVARLDAFAAEMPLDRCIREINQARALAKLSPVSRMQGREVETLLFAAIEICPNVEAAYGAYLLHGDAWDRSKGFPIAKWAKTPMQWLETRRGAPSGDGYKLVRRAAK